MLQVKWQCIYTYIFNSIYVYIYIPYILIEHQWTFYIAKKRPFIKQFMYRYKLANKKINGIKLLICISNQIYNL